jgi:hypothetical protein
VAEGAPVCACGLPFVSDIPISARRRSHCREHRGTVHEPRKTGKLRFSSLAQGLEDADSQTILNSEF